MSVSRRTMERRPGRLELVTVLPLLGTVSWSDSMLYYFTTDLWCFCFGVSQLWAEPSKYRNGHLTKGGRREKERDREGKERGKEEKEQEDRLTSSTRERGDLEEIRWENSHLWARIQSLALSRHDLCIEFIYSQTLMYI